MTRYAIGDIHGGSKTFRALLEKLNLKHDDQLYLLGDYVDRGPDSKGVLDMILQLMVSGYDVRPVRGNHDDMMLQSFIRTRGGLSSSWLEEYGVATFGSFGVDSFKDLPRKYLMLLETMPHILMDDDYVFVHAGLDMERDDPLSVVEIW